MEGRDLDSERIIRLVVEKKVLDKMKRVREAELDCCNWHTFSF